jgi:hypothetical protein
LVNRTHLLILAVLVFASACAHEIIEEEPMDDTYIIPSNGVTTPDGILQIGASNFWKDEYVDEQGETRRGLTAMLTLWLLDLPDPSDQVRVHRGQVLEFQGYQIEVVDIGRGRRSPLVRVVVRPVEGAGP